MYFPDGEDGSTEMMGIKGARASLSRLQAAWRVSQISEKVSGNDLPETSFIVFWKLKTGQRRERMRS